MLFFVLACQPTTFTSSSLWSGFHYEWDKLSHRISLHQAQLHNDGSMTMGMIGGDWSTGETFTDLPTFRMHQQQISDPYFSTIYGETTLTLVADQPQEISIPLDQNVAGIALQGFRINTDIAQGEEYPDDYDPAHGYTASGYNIGVEPDLENRNATVHAQVDWGPQDRENMNTAMQFAQTEVTVYWAQITHNQVPQTYKLDFATSHDYSPPYSEHELLEESINHEQSAAIAIRSFSLSIPDQEGSDMGSYWRRMGIEILPTDNGSLIQVDASNSSILEEIAVDFMASITVDVYSLSHPDSTIDHVNYSEEHDIGSHSYPKP